MKKFSDLLHWILGSPISDFTKSEAFLLVALLCQVWLSAWWLQNSGLPALTGMQRRVWYNTTFVRIQIIVGVSIVGPKRVCYR